MQKIDDLTWQSPRSQYVLTTYYEHGFGNVEVPYENTWSLNEKDQVQFALDVFSELNYFVSTNLEACTEEIAEKAASKLGYDYKKVEYLCMQWLRCDAKYEEHMAVPVRWVLQKFDDNGVCTVLKGS